MDLSASGMRISSKGKPIVRRGDVETFELITSVRDGVQGIFLARERSKDMLLRLFDAGAHTVLQKPPRTEVLLDAVRRLNSRIEREDSSF